MKTAQHPLIFPAILLFFGVVLSLGITSRFYERASQYEFDLYKAEKLRQLSDSQKTLETAFTTTYDALRTIATLPGVSKISHKKDPLSVDAKTTVQRIYNSIASNVSVSEIYIVPEDLDPDRPGHRSKEPYITFDEVILGKSKPQDSPASHSDLEEVEVFEYREMKRQNEHFRKSHPNLSEIQGLKYPALTSQELITCDNSEFNEELLLKHENHARMGILYSLPFYGEDGKFKGLVSAIFRSKVLEGFIDLPYTSLYRETPRLVLHHERSQKPSAPLKNSTSEPFDLNISSSLHFVDASPWVLKTEIPAHVFLDSPPVHRAKSQALGIFIAGIIVSGLLAFSLYLLRSTRDKALLLAEAMVKEAEMERSRAAQNSKLASLGEMSAGIAHEINNPLSIIQGTVTSLKRNLSDAETFDKKVETIRKSIQRITKIVSGLRKYSRSTEIKDYQIHSLERIIQEALVLTIAKSKRHHTPVIVEASSAGLITCDEVEIEQVLINLICNAIDAVKDTEKPWVKLKIEEAEHQVRLLVTDSGPGIPEAIRLKIFDPFFTTKQTGQGTGLGLSITKGILDQHKATIEILADSPNTCFEIKFPRASKKVAA